MGKENGAGNGNRTRIVGLGSRCLTIRRYPQNRSARSIEDFHANYQPAPNRGMSARPAPYLALGHHCRYRKPDSPNPNAHHCQQSHTRPPNPADRPSRLTPSLILACCRPQTAVISKMCHSTPHCTAKNLSFTETRKTHLNFIEAYAFR